MRPIFRGLGRQPSKGVGVLVWIEYFQVKTRGDVMTVEERIERLERSVSHYRIGFVLLVVVVCGVVVMGATNDGEIHDILGFCVKRLHKYQ